MRFFQTISAVALLCSSALALEVTAPSTGTTWDFSTPETIKFTSSPGDPSYISIILIDVSNNWQIKIADNVITSTGEYTTQANPSVPDGTNYKIELIDSSGVLTSSPKFTVRKGASHESSSGSSSSISTSTSTSTTATSATTSTATVTDSSSSNSGTSHTDSSSSTSAVSSSSESESDSTTSSAATATAATTTATSSATSTQTSFATSTGAAAAIAISKVSVFQGLILGLLAVVV